MKLNFKTMDRFVMMKRKTIWKHETGVVAVEFALILPLVLMILFGIVNYGILLYDQAVITNAAREGARWGAINATAANIGCTNESATGSGDPCQIANSYTHNNLITFSGSAPSSTTASGSGTAGTTVQVTVTYRFTQIGWILGSPSSTLTATSVMYHE
jgi:Flp pilus assembly protein TadG